MVLGGLLLTPMALAADGGTGDLVFAADAAFSDAKLQLLQRQDLRGLATVPVSAKELRRRQGLAPAASAEPSATIHLQWHPYVAGWHGLSPDMSENTLWFDAIPPMGTVVAALSDGDAFFGHLQVDLNPIRYAFVDDGVYSPWRIDSYTNMEFPRESWLAMTTDHLTVVAGRLKSGIGHGVFGNLFLNGRAPWYDQVQATFHTDAFRMFWLVGTSATFLYPEEAAVQSYGATAPPRAGWDPLNNYDSARFDAPAKTFMYRRFEYAPWPWLVVGLGEMGVVGGKLPDLSQLLPVVAWHNAYAPGSTNVMLGADVSVAPLPGVLVFGELVMDDMTTINEVAESKPTSLGWQLGAQWHTELGAGVSSGLAVEATHVDPWTYARWQPYLVLQQRQILPPGFRFIDVPLGYPWGGDLDQVGVSWTLTGKRGLRVTAAVEEMWRGPIRLGALTTNVLTDDAGEPVTDSFGQPVQVPLYYDLDTHAGAGALAAVLASPREQRTTASLRTELPLLEHLTLLTTVFLSHAEHADNVNGAVATRILLHGGLLLSL